MDQRYEFTKDYHEVCVMLIVMIDVQVDSEAWMMLMLMEMGSIELRLEIISNSDVKVRVRLMFWFMGECGIEVQDYGEACMKLIVMGYNEECMKSIVMERVQDYGEACLMSMLMVSDHVVGPWLGIGLSVWSGSDVRTSARLKFRVIMRCVDIYSDGMGDVDDGGEVSDPGNRVRIMFTCPERCTGITITRILNIALASSSEKDPISKCNPIFPAYITEHRTLTLAQTKVLDTYQHYRRQLKLIINLNLNLTITLTLVMNPHSNCKTLSPEQFS
ncbi:Sarcoplasmic/Endoplasmic Reticulum Calcium Atpase 1 [Manis pentadactyla]|nr:Sarcoplasmic/Endoplasmic Reticulum Calcium Atpase 1 [Manis pentadactyla]